ncbi:alpha/beta fold hydrolase [Mycetocola zhadangensis]|uniref:Alpha/beta hydrolase n=1 Tax=Mycetocola zhadangensis TaxID=1164595 RepID=A0A3L7J5U3_9MICO|nr:alpha/beta hydrolase [Mycetocola zhadangensis]RLQ86088.1 alpha/beta hydrolase [Mycetocola zhadangensis]GGE88273.1 dihydrolipoamide acetyltransferase [Mycetocola zhadangensis]
MSSRFPDAHSHVFDDLVLRVRRWDAVSPDPRNVIVLVHGIGVSSRYFMRLANVLARSATVLSIDLPGFGPNKRPDRQLSVEDLGAVVATYLVDAGIRAPILVGHSMGAQVVVETARRLPAAGLVLIGPVVDERAPTAWQQGMRLARDVVHESPSSNWIVLTDYLRSGIRWYLTELPAMLGYRIEETLPLLDVPVLVIRGAQDPVAPEGWARALARRSPGARVVSVPGSGHVVQHTGTAAVAAEIEQLAENIRARTVANG